MDGFWKNYGEQLAQSVTSFIGKEDTGASADDKDEEDD